MTYIFKIDDEYSISYGFNNYPKGGYFIQFYSFQDVFKSYGLDRQVQVLSLEEFCRILKDYLQSKGVEKFRTEFENKDINDFITTKIGLE